MRTDRQTDRQESNSQNGRSVWQTENTIMKRAHSSRWHIQQYRPAYDKHLFGENLRLIFVAQGPGYVPISCFLSNGCFLVCHIYIFVENSERVPKAWNSVRREVQRVPRFPGSRHQQQTNLLIGGHF